MSLRSDASDLASHFEQAANDSAVSQIRSQVSRVAAVDACVECGEAIPEDRREAAPWATRCIDCQERQEAVR